MYKIYLKQAWELLRENKLLSVVSMFGTALAICMIMVIVIVWQIRTANYSPEDNRDRMLYVSMVNANGIENPQINNISGISTWTIKECFYPSKIAEAVSIVNHNYTALASSVDHTVEFKADVCYTDAAFWRIFNFKYIVGKPYSSEAVESGIKDAVISESVARRLFGTTDVVGNSIELNYVNYTIKAVVRDVSIMAESAYGDVWVPYTTNNTLWDNESERLIGSYKCYILARSAADLPSLKEELIANVERMNGSQRESRLLLGGAPDTIMENFMRDGINDPQVDMVVMRYIMIIAMIMLIPAINMSGLTLSRMRKRMSELGVRRAFGATRMELVWQILCQNLLQTMLGGALGLILSYVAIVALSSWLLPDISQGVSNTFLNAEMMFNPLIFLFAFVICMLLNLMSAGVPAWRSSKVHIVEALNEH